MAKYDGAAWTVFNSLNSGVADDFIWSIAFDTGGVLWAGSETGLSIYDGKSWTPYTVNNSGLPGTGVNAVAIDRNGLAWIGTTNGLASYNMSSGTKSVSARTAFIKNPLSVNNYPNPFTHATTIGYSLPGNGRVTLRIVNAMGKVVATLVDGNKSAGKHIVYWNGSTGQDGLLSPGIYLCELVCGKNRLIRKMHLLR
jgi:hypothetical protein